MGEEDFEREREEFIRSSTVPYHPYAWELDGHHIMRRSSLRRLRHPWRQTRSDWIKSIAFLLVVAGIVFGLIWLSATGSR